MGRPILKGATDQSTTITIIDSTTGAPETGVTFETSGIALWYRRLGAAVTAITETTQTPSGAHSDGGVCHLSDGVYRLDLPDAACASSAGVDEVEVGGTVTGMIVIGNSHPLVNYNPYDAVRMGMSSLPNAAPDASGGMLISDGGGLDVDTLLGRITGNVALASVCTDARLAELSAANLPADIDTLSGRLTAARAGYLDELSAANLPADVDTLIGRLTAARAGYLDELSAANLPADVDTLLDRLTSDRAGYLDELSAANLPADIDTLTGRLTAARAGYLDELSASNLPADIDSITGKLPSKDYLTGTDNADGDVEMDDATGNFPGSVASVAGAVGSVTGNVGGTIGSLATQAKADVNAEVDNALNTAVPGSPTSNSINERIVAIDNKLPSKAYLTGTVNSDGDVEMQDTTGDFNAAQKASINTEVDTALNTAVPGSPTAGSINERVAAIDDKLPSKSYLAGSADADGGIDSTEQAQVQSDVVTALGTYVCAKGIKKNTQLLNFTFMMLDSSRNPVTGITVNGTVTLDGAAESGVSGTITEIANGKYQFDAAAGDLNGDDVAWTFSGSGAEDSVFRFRTV